jgi:DNA-binding NarL/FixJ family response regulator
MTRPPAFTDKEQAIGRLLSEGYTVKEVAVELVELGHHMAPATVASRIRVLAAKVPNPHDLPPIAAIKLYFRTQRAA